ncbi:MAG: WG repeat-containing protein [Oscillospiraceae bacterium]|jgi:hypothetical protein|nr:WG repeat-containing protein [Oscillospiraceae bacterium]
MLKKLGLLIGCAAILGIAWLAVINSATDSQKQAALVKAADDYLSDKVYVRAVPLLETAAGYKTGDVEDIESKLKSAYLGLGEKKKYTDLLDKQMSAPGATPEVFFEAARYYLDSGKIEDALTVLRSGVIKTSDAGLTELYEAERYAYKTGRASFDEISAVSGGYVQVKLDGKWGIASASGVQLLPCVYDRISTFSDGKAIVSQNGEVFAVDSKGRRLALLKDETVNIENFGNLANDRFSLKRGGKYVRSSSEFSVGSVEFEEIGMYSNGYAAAKTNGKWGLVDIGTEFLLPAEYDDVIRDTLGRAYFRGAVFARKGSDVYLFTTDSEGALVQSPITYEDAKPFIDGLAAVKQNGKWGFIDIDGSIKIDCEYDDALSFSGHLAAVKSGELWGYITLGGKIVIEPQFTEAGSFYKGSAFVQSIDKGRQLISLIEKQ